MNSNSGFSRGFRQHKIISRKSNSSNFPENSAPTKSVSAHPDLSKISKISNNIFLSGIFPMEENHELIKDFNIKYILSCVDRSSVSEVHDKLLINNPNLVILYLPYNDDIYQNLWKENKNNVDMATYIESMSDYDKLRKQLALYNNKPMIEVGYHFINEAISTNNNILIHCMAGISRSVSLVTYFIMKKYCVPFDNAINFIKKKREIASPNHSFKSQLRQYQIDRDKFSERGAATIISRVLNYKY